MRRLTPFLALLFWLLLGGSAAAADADFAVTNGWYFGQTGGYAITNDGGVQFWRDYQRLGGARTLGYPASWRFVGPDGFVYQATQGGLLQWRPESERAVLANAFDMLSSASRDEWLRSARAVPHQVTDDGSRGDPTRSAAIRMAWLEDEGIRSYYFANPNPAELGEWTQQHAIELYGLPTSKPERIGPFVVQRFQRVALQRWLDNVPGMPPPGSVVRVLGGDLLKEAGLVPAHAAGAAAADSSRARFDPELLARINLLAETPAGKPLQDLALRSPVAFVWAPLPADVGGLFSARRRWVAVNVRWRDADPKAVATLLAHELSHLRDVVEEKAVWTSTGCFATEQEAFRVQGRVWEAFYPGGKRNAATELERQQNFILSAIKTDPEAFAARINQIYQHECGVLRS